MEKDLDHQLFAAVKKQDLKAVKDFLRQGADPNFVFNVSHNEEDDDVGSYRPVRMGDTYTPVLYEAVLVGDEKICELLLKKGANPNSEYDHYIIDSDGVSNPNEEKIKEPPLCEAVRADNLKICQLLLEHNASVNVQNDSGETLLHMAIKNDSMDVCKLLLKHHVDVNTQIPTKDDTPLHYAVRKGNVEIAELLIDHNADFYIYNREERFPIHVAFLSQNVDMCKMFLEKGCDPEAENKMGHRLIHDVAWSAEEEKSTQLCALLIEKGANVNAIEGEPDSPLYWAVVRGNADMCRLLLENNADYRAKTNYEDGSGGNTPLQMINANDFAEIIDVFADYMQPEEIMDTWKKIEWHKKEKHTQAYIEAVKKADFNARAQQLTDEQMAAIDGVGKEKE